MAIDSVFSVDCRNGTTFFVRGPEGEYIEVPSCDVLCSLTLVGAVCAVGFTLFVGRVLGLGTARDRNCGVRDRTKLSGSPGY